MTDGLRRRTWNAWQPRGLRLPTSHEFIERNAARPFFLLVAHEAVHLPVQTPEDTRIAAQSAKVEQDKRLSNPSQSTVRRISFS